ncbi:MULTISPECIES: hypothetical protein [unclassified Serratia (in: enterobacteria)]|uniref:hypothetical protein n=1 Tax=unclassified Serratia (in: enterobacteria) TaxID=2647522 RepID=UPI0018A8DA28|nr:MULTISPECIES: hypothetical protein [unclassified Serratia (in: enterobacteria)]
MKSFANEVDSALRNAEAQGGLGSSATANAILACAKKHYSSADGEGKAAIIAKINALSKEPGVPFPSNYLTILEG